MKYDVTSVASQENPNAHAHSESLKAMNSASTWDSTKHKTKKFNLNLGDDLVIICNFSQINEIRRENEIMR